MKFNRIKLGLAAIFTVVSASFASGANAASLEAFDMDKYYDITSVETVEETSFEDLINENASYAGPRVFDGGELGVIIGELDEANIILDRIINMGTKIWKIIEASKPVVDTQFTTANALPTGVTQWQDMQGWQAPRSKVYRTFYKNGFNMNVVDFTYRIIYTYGGTVNGKGKYLTQVQVAPAELSVAWGFKFEASAAADLITNAGTKAAPMAGMQFGIKWRVSTVIKEIQESDVFYIRGDGTFLNLSNGN